MAVVDYFLKIDGVTGESADDKHKGEIDIESFSFGQNQSGTFGAGGGGGAGKVQAHDLNIVKKTDKSTPVLFLGCANGTHYKTATLTARKAGGKQQDYLKITLEDVLVSSYQIGGSSGSDIVPLEQVSLNFAKLEISYKEQMADGSLGGEIKQKYDYLKNVKV